MSEPDRQSSSGDLDELCQHTWRDLYRYIYYQVQNREEAEDVTQETYARLVSHQLATVAGCVSAHLRTVALNIIRDRWRRKRTRGTTVPLETVPEPAGADEAAPADGQIAVQAALAALPEEWRSVVRLRILADMLKEA